MLDGIFYIIQLLVTILNSTFSDVMAPERPSSALALTWWVTYETAFELCASPFPSYSGKMLFIRLQSIIDIIDKWNIL